MLSLDIDPIKDLFPYPALRTGQETFITRCSAALHQGRHVVVSAPNGFGKTILTLCATIPVAYENWLKIVYCYRTHTQNARVIAELDAIRRHVEARGGFFPGIDVYFQGVPVRGRNGSCLHDRITRGGQSPSDASTACSFLRGAGKCDFYKKARNINTRDIPRDNTPRDANAIHARCKVLGACPYYATKNLLKESRLATCSYNWMFHPAIHEGFLKSMAVDLAVPPIFLRLFLLFGWRVTARYLRIS